jgi:hypothetical protein
LSPSQVRTFLDCPVRWDFKYRHRLPDPQTSNLALGKAVHAALGENFRQKIETREDLPVTGVMALFRQAWSEQRGETEFAESEDADEIGKCGEALVMRYMEEIAPFVQPAASELFVAGEIGGVRVQGIIDVVDEDHRILDLKTRTRRPPSISFSDVFQVATYRQLLPTTDGCVHIDSLIKTKTVQVFRQTLELTPEDLQITVVLYPPGSRGDAEECLSAESGVALLLAPPLRLLAAVRAGVRRACPGCLRQREERWFSGEGRDQKTGGSSHGVRNSLRGSRPSCPPVPMCGL